MPPTTQHDDEPYAKKRDCVPVHLRLLDVEHDGVQYFLSHFAKQPHILTQQYHTARSTLFDEGAEKAWNPKHSTLHGKAWRSHDPRSVTIFVRSMGGVAYTTGTIVDDAHKEIHVSAEYIAKIVEQQKSEVSPSASSTLTPSTQPTPTATPAPSSSFLSRFRQPSSSPPSSSIRPTPRDAVELELKGVLVHEIVHTIQFTGSDTCPGGLVEGMADWVRLKAGLAAPHWRPPTKGDRKRHWDAGYSLTAYFLVWLETKLHYPHLVPHLNQALAHERWKDGELLSNVVGEPVDLKALWKEFCRGSKDGDDARCDTDSSEEETT